MNLISVELLQQWDKFPQWPRLGSGQPSKILRIEEPSDLSVLLPNKNKFSMSNVKRTSLQLRNNIVAVVSVLPLETVSPFATAAQQARAVLQQSGVSTPQIFEKLGTWMNRSPGDEPASTVAASDLVDDGVLLRLELRHHSLGQGWYAVIDLAQDPRRTLAQRLQGKP